jgi:hypothetical protein
MVRRARARQGVAWQRWQAHMLTRTARVWGQMNSTLKVPAPEFRTLIEKIKVDLRKRAEKKAKRMLLKRPKRH